MSLFHPFCVPFDFRSYIRLLNLAQLYNAMVCSYRPYKGNIAM